MNPGSRTSALERLHAVDRWDLIVIGGGITGAGVLREAAHRGLRALLIEQNDFASGTSSRSSKMVHGGLRYLGQGAFGMTRSAVRERERLLVEAPGLVERMGVVFTLRRHKFPGRRAFALLLALYDRMAGIHDHRFIPVERLAERAPGITTDGLSGAAYYTDALTDDARLVLRILAEATSDSECLAVNYVKAVSVVETDGLVTGLNVSDTTGDGADLEVAADVVINATGSWADELVKENRLRPLRGSHLIVPSDRLPVTDALTFFHPRDGRPVYAFPWLGATVIGTTDLDHREGLDVEPAITEAEFEYLLEAVQTQFGAVDLTREDVVSTLSGIRPVIDSGKGRDPSKEKREEAIWIDRGMVTVSGGKLTTFRPIARKALAAAAPRLANRITDAATQSNADASARGMTFERSASAEQLEAIPEDRRAQLAGRYGHEIDGYVDAVIEPGDSVPLAETPFDLADVRFALRHESVEHLDDLMLRRTRIGNLTRDGGGQLLDRIEPLCRDELGWDAQRWRSERDRYIDLWKRYYWLPKSVKAVVANDPK